MIARCRSHYRLAFFSLSALLFVACSQDDDISAIRRAVLDIKGDTLYRLDKLYNAVGVKPFLPSIEL